jgi:hypothetical protein
MKKRLDDMDEGELEALFIRLGKLIEKRLPAGDLVNGKCGYILLIVDRARDGSTCQYASNIPRDAAPELMHELADFIEQEIDAEEAERGDDYEPLKDEDGGN